jgi:SAM-dependent methyltransferase
MVFQTLRTRLREKLNNENARIGWVQRQLAALPVGTLLLDAGCGSQQYRKFCTHLEYRAQDFGQYVKDITEGFASSLGGESGYHYGPLDYTGDIWAIDEKSGHFDAILCTEVFEHIPFPNETVSEFARLMKPDGKLVLTVPSNCLRHMDPYFFYSGFSNRYLERMLGDAGFEIETIEPVGDYYSWLAVEVARTMDKHGIWAKLSLFPALFWYIRRPKTPDSVNTLCMGYHVVARRVGAGGDAGKVQALT